ncbi:DUF6008 family protein [Streptomyces goshikiensis]|uniref:DUF6008 family protein n=1 Tax=Streptomyces goshikiensis TaxID=1942 RepID=UPI0036656F73
MPGMPGMAGMGGPVSTLDTVTAVLFILWAVSMWLAVGVLAYANRGPVKPWLYKTSVGLIGLGVIGQIGHFQEHVSQAVYWIAHPTSPAWMTPWANSLSRGMGQVDTTKPSLGMEILHLTGNFIFLAGLVGIVLITKRVTGQLQSRKWAKMGVWMQGIHGLEHVVLTASVALGAKRAIGLSTWFGTIDPGPALTTYRVWWHFVANLIGTGILALSLYHLWREKRSVKAGFGERTGDEASQTPGDGKAPGDGKTAAHGEPCPTCHTTTATAGAGSELVGAGRAT